MRAYSDFPCDSQLPTSAHLSPTRRDRVYLVRNVSKIRIFPKRRYFKIPVSKASESFKMSHFWTRSGRNVARRRRYCFFIARRLRPDFCFRYGTLNQYFESRFCEELAVFRNGPFRPRITIDVHHGCIISGHPAPISTSWMF